MTKEIRYGDGFDDNPFIDDIVRQVVQEAHSGMPHDMALYEWIKEQKEKAAAEGVEYGDFTERERAAILARFVDATVPF